MGKLGRMDSTIYMGNDTARMRRQEMDNKDAKAEKRGSTIYAGDLKMVMDPIALKKKQLQKQAMQVAKDQFATDRKIDGDMAKRQRRIEEYQEQAKWANEQINGYKSEQEALKKQYGITDDSREQMDLELMRKARKVDMSELSDEEVDRLANMGELTDYQSLSLGYDAAIGTYEEFIEEAAEVIRDESRSISSIKQGLLGRKYDMTDAAADKDAQMLSASKQIAGMLYAEAKDKIEEEMQELFDKAKEEAEKREEKEEKLEEQKAEKAEQEIAPEETEEIKKVQADMAEMGDMQGKVQEEVNKLLKEADLLPEDLKGIKVDRML